MDCPNCGAQVDADAALCAGCGFDLNTSVADEVRRLREEGRIKPGRLHPHDRTVAPADAGTGEGPRQGGAEHLDAGL